MRRFLRPFPVALGLIAALGAIALAKTARPAYRARAQALYDQAAAKRQKLHLDAKAACARDPTPEVQFAKALPVQPGQPFHLRIPGSFTGKVSPSFESDAVQVTRATIQKGALEIDGRIAEGALPATVHLTLVRELCPLTLGTDALEIVGRTRWEVAFPNGWSLAMVCGAPAEDGSNCQSTWTGKDIHQEMRATLQPQGEGRYRVRYHLNPKQIAIDREITQRVMNGPSPELKARMQQAQEALGTCEKQPQAKQMACIQAHIPALEKASAAYNEAMEHLAGPPGPALIGCDNAKLEANDGKVSAEGETCGEQGPKLGNGQGTVQLLR